MSYPVDYGQLTLYMVFTCLSVFCSLAACLFFTNRSPEFARNRHEQIKTFIDLAQNQRSSVGARRESRAEQESRSERERSLINKEDSRESVEA